MRWLIEFATVSCLGFAAWGYIIGVEPVALLALGFGAVAFGILGAFNRGTL